MYIIGITGCTGGNTKTLTGNIYCGQDWTFKWRHPPLSVHKVVIILCNYHVNN